MRAFVLGRIRRTEICINLIRIYDVCNVRITCMYASHVCSIHPYIHIYIRIGYVCVCVCVFACVCSLRWRGKDAIKFVESVTVADVQVHHLKYEHASP